MTNNWKLHPFSKDEERVGVEIAKALRLSPVVGLLLARRGINSPEEASHFFKPKLEELHDPFLMRDMDKAVARLNMAIGRKEKILIYGDYDVDGTTAVTLVYKYLRTVGCSESSLDYYIPDRYDEGYGISYRGIDYAHQWGAKLVIVLDCGIKAVEKVAYAKSLGIDFIICDHHNPDEKLPDAVAVLDAKRKDNTYPFEHLSGCGVGFKFMQAFALDNGFSIDELCRNLDLLAVSIASDIVPVTGENRILAYHGLKRLNQNPSLGLKTIIRMSGLENTRIDMGDIVFKIGPRINASGRMMNGREAVELLLASDKETAKKCCAAIDNYNDQRRELDKSTTDEATAIVESDPEYTRNKVIVLYKPDWHKGVIGIVASRLTERYSRPTIVLTKSSEHISGSARSVEAFDIYKAIESCRDILVNFGGHTYAAGLTLAEKDLPLFTKRIQTFANENLQECQLKPSIDIDAQIELADVTPKLLRDLKRMSPFGPENTKPVFLTSGIYDAGSSRTVGKNQEHLKLDLTDAYHQIGPLKGIAFRQAASAEQIKGNKPFSICFTVEENYFNGTTSMQMLIQDISTDQ
ncbi:single-stranded-DNA-specific exonuclease RecJ [Porphyromonas crevioricanis JCM 15906]|uniref:Single-stranded-DNA-specific exonuclease RecJ n=2 Tax=Porphyromonas crevioricanis TaxID=393921 RepID=A0A2X4SV30_9PORP|nr:single-stranded-DNA-specific exonuclease RecJ [Porphyromonas crevioricanis]KGN96473.1 recombinase RecJ [Porphyromonas crevioricanis]SJZ93985.1 single-stranded-DNA-specific exonuclease [Porphyromonas crevioricanis]SQH73601.1 Single-stranded-DNA-specific exonuclease recJ [Porphyromonas crevioricanis]GAD05492.1 single-stranded-DNA-specific exonuclease RecJ [Porphyromonas crevioricanis JCM 15906]GAD07719.1 single-stranded-DNA-specific exonuclease RecJ [Porphyromonas crevioricanis JCM 13913]